MRKLSKLGSAHQNIVCSGSMQGPFNETVRLPAEIKPVKDQEEELHPRYGMLHSSAGISYPINLGSCKSNGSVCTLKPHIESNASLSHFSFQGWDF